MWDNSMNRNSQALIYGNVFYRPSGDTWSQANGILGGWTGGNGEDFYNMHVYNNTFININQPSLSEFPARYGNNSASNNLWYNSTSPAFSRFSTHDYNHFINSGGTHSEVNGSTATSGDPFVSMANLDFHLVAHTSPGMALPAPFDKDPNGLARGASGWDRGAFSVSTGLPSPPAQPTNVLITVR